MLLGADTDHEGWDIDKLFADSNMLGEDHDAGVVNGASEVSLLDEGLESSLKELGGGQTEDIIEFALVVLEESKSHHSTDEGLTFKESSGIGLVHSEQDASCLSELGESELSSPHFSLATKTVGTDQLELVDQLLSLERSPRSLGSFTVVRVLNGHLEG